MFPEREDRKCFFLSFNSGFSVHNSVVVHSDDGEELERFARYLARPPVRGETESEVLIGTQAGGVTGAAFLEDKEPDTLERSARRKNGRN